MASVVAIVGAGEAGLACARELAGRARTVVVDRRPVEGADHEATAIRWDGAVLLAMGPAGAVEIAADALVIATGTRPLGRAELGLVGTRPAGVLSAPVACELSEQGLVRPARPAVIGGGDWAARAVAALAGAGAEHVTVVAPDGILTPLPPSDRITIHEGLRAPLGWRRPAGRAARVRRRGVRLRRHRPGARPRAGAKRGRRGVGWRPHRVRPAAARIPAPRTERRRAGAEAAQAALALTGGQATIGPWWSSPSLPPSA